MKTIIFLLIFLFFCACSSYETKESKIEKLPVASELKKAENNNGQPLPKENPPSPASPMGLAVQSMKKAQDDMSQTIKLLEELRRGDQILDFRNNRTSAFQTLQTFFGVSFLGYDEHRFWFLAQNDQKVGLYEDDGFLEKGTIGLFMSFKRFIAVQRKGQKTTETEFYVDTTKKDLMVHRYRNQNTTNENYVLSGK
ncbi:MAG: hypothetical protein HUU50_14180 [Candidatus Brocadiae bacterium]|nr:hypothetical protein [Candidatus Brocadiia bacterium]